MWILFMVHPVDAYFLKVLELLFLSASKTSNTKRYFVLFDRFAEYQLKDGRS
jgi:hypothetical protein